MDKPEKILEHGDGCRSFRYDENKCDCGMVDYNLAFDEWEKYHNEKIKKKDEVLDNLTVDLKTYIIQNARIIKENVGFVEALFNRDEVLDMVVEELEGLEVCITFPPDRHNAVVDWKHIKDLLTKIKEAR